MATDEISMSMALMALGRPSDFRWLQDFPLFWDRQAPIFKLNSVYAVEGSMLCVYGWLGGQLFLSLQIWPPD